MIFLILVPIYWYKRNIKTSIMGKQKLTELDILHIRRKLNQKLTHQEIANQYGVKRETITKIKKAMTHPNHPNSRWSREIKRSDITIDVSTTMNITPELVDYIITSKNIDDIQSLFKTIVNINKRYKLIHNEKN